MIELIGASIQLEKRMLLQRCDLRFRAGEVWGILGPNGAGKTSLLHALAKLLPLFAGQIHFSLLPAKCSPKMFAQQVGILFQESSSAFHQTVQDYCLTARFPHLSNYVQRFSDLDKQVLQDALDIVELNDLRFKPLPTLSGGEKRRAAIAALLTQAPKIYLLDEPTNHLDLYFQAKLLKHFQALAKNHSNLIIMTLHDINLAQRYCDRILLLFPDGKIKAGETEAMMRSENLSELYKHSIKGLRIGEETLWIGSI